MHDQLALNFMTTASITFNLGLAKSHRNNQPQLPNADGVRETMVSATASNAGECADVGREVGDD
jgi:hypothetical protein